MDQASESPGAPDQMALKDRKKPGAPLPGGRRVGFLPIRTNLFDRCFISAVCFVAIHLLWMRFLEAFLPLGIATALSLLLAALIIWRG